MSEAPEDGWTVYRLPRSHWHCQLSNFDWASVGPPSFERRVTEFVDAAAGGAAPHLLLTGRPGSGKSHVGVGVYRRLAARLGTGVVTWLSVPQFCEAVKRGYAPGEPDPWDDVEAARRLVVLDDLFGRTLTAHEKDHIVTRLLDMAYQNNAAVVVTMNPEVRELADRLPPHEVSRLLAGATVIPVQAHKDWRR